jgi:predicted lysophospholipase L1 biosynthesis ABC-type transport system permease subunit
VDYFATLGTRVLEGRVFTGADREGSEPVIVVGASMANALWPGRSALNQCVRVGRAPAACSRVIGVVQDARRNGIHEDPLMQYYVPLDQQAASGYSSPEILVRPRADAAAMIPALKRAVREIDPTIRFVDASVLQDRVEPLTRTWRTGATMFSLFAALALVVAAVGMFATIAYLVEQRRYEIGVRMALGARGANVFALMLRGPVVSTSAGIVVGIAVALALSNVVDPLLFETTARDGVTLVAVAAILLFVASMASGWPALRATAIEPVIALRAD